MLKSNKPKNKTSKIKCTQIKCVDKNHGDQLCEAIRKPGSTDDQSISYITQLCGSFSSVLDSDGRSALHTAALVGKTKVVHYLATHGANVNLKEGSRECTPLHFAILSGNIGTAIVLLKYGADTKVVDRNGLTPINYIVNQQPIKYLSSKEPPILQGYAWGINANYNLGLAICHAREFPEQLEVPLKRHDFLSDVSMSKFHTVFLSNEGKVYVCGHGIGGRLGLETDTSVIIPQHIKVSKSKTLKISVAVDHTVFLNEKNEVFSCGTNKYHQLGFIPTPPSVSTPQVLSQWHSKNPDIEVIGVEASAYHTVLWSSEEVFTCGLNAGQLGHSDTHNETFIDLPRTIAYIKHLDKSKVGEITKVAVSEGATVVVTAKDNIIVCSEYKIRLIHLRVNDIKKICCSGGILDGNLNLGIDSFLNRKDVCLKVAALSANGELYVWTAEPVENKFTVWYINNIFDFCIHSRGLSLVNNFQETSLAHFEEEDEDDDNSFIPLNDVVFRPSKFKGIVDMKRIKRGNKIHSLYRTHAIFSDPKGNNFIALQYDPKLFQKRQVGSVSNSFRQDISNYYFKIGESENNYDVEIMIEDKCFPANSYLLAYDSDYLYERIVELLNKRNAENYSCSSEEKIRINLPNFDADLFEDLLNIIYTNKMKRVSFNAPNRFIHYLSDKGNSNFKLENLVCIHWDEKEQDIVQILKKYTIFNDNQGRYKYKKDKILNYLLKPYVDISCTLKMKHLQKALLLANEVDNQKRPEQIRFLSDVYAPGRVYEREKFREFWDVSFRCEDGEIVEAHKCILSARSSYFETLLGFRWSQSGDADVVDISLPSHILKPLLDFFYTNDSRDVAQSRDLDFLCQVLTVSHQYMVEDLHMLCQRSLSKCLTLKNSFDFLKFCVTFDARSLQEVVLEFICLNMSYFFDAKVLRSLNDEMINCINHTYQEVVMMPRNSESVEQVLVQETIACEFDYVDGFYFIEEIKEQKPHSEISEEYLDFGYTPSKATDMSLYSTKTLATSLPSLEDLELALHNNPLITHQTPEQWIEEAKGIDFGQAKASQSRTSSERKRKSSHKKRVRKSSSSSQVSSSSNSESEYTQDLESSEPFSFEDLEERLPQRISHEDEWVTVGKSKLEYIENVEITEVGNELQDLKLRSVEGGESENFTSKLNHHCQQFSHVTNSTSLQVPKTSSSLLDNSPFPTLSESLSMGTPAKDSSVQFSRMPKFQPKSGKKSKKASSQSTTTEPQSPPSPAFAWGTSPKESYTSLSEIMKKECVSTVETSKVTRPKSAKCLLDGTNISNGFVPSDPLAIQENKSLDESRYWNPVTNSVVESPKEVGDVSFSSIMQNEVTYNKHLEFERNKPLSVIQLEEKAMKELLEFYGGEYNPEERIMVTRCGIDMADPSWNVQYRHV